MIHSNLKLAIELRAQAKDLETQAKDLTTVANALIINHLKEGEEAIHPEGAYGKIVYCKASTSSKFDKDVAKQKLVEFGAPADVVVKAFKLATTTSPKSGGIKYYPPD